MAQVSVPRQLPVIQEIKKWEILEKKGAFYKTNMTRVAKAKGANPTKARKPRRKDQAVKCRFCPKTFSASRWNTGKKNLKIINSGKWCLLYNFLIVKAGNPYWKGMLSKVDLLYKLVYITYILNRKYDFPFLQDKLP
jgi:hypothetical protein